MSAKKTILATTALVSSLMIFSWGCTKDNKGKESASPAQPSTQKPRQPDQKQPTEDTPTRHQGDSQKTPPENPSPKTAIAPIKRVPPGGLGAKAAKAKKTLVDGQNTLALDLYKRLGKKGGNLFFSPLSISIALSMTYTGAHGKTASQMHKGLHLGVSPDQVPAAFSALIKEIQPPADKKPYQLTLANKIFVQQGHPVLPSFKKTLQIFYGCAAENVNFKQRKKAADKINRWVAKNTQDKIKKIVSPSMFDDLSRLVLANAIYFKGKWKYLFKKGRTQPRTFYLNPTSQIKVDTMYQKARFRHGRTSEAQILEMVYQGGDLSLVIVLPHKKDGLAALEKRLSVEQIKKWISKTRRGKLKVYLPKFKLRWGRSIKKDLIEMGMPAPFSQPAADFRHINGHPGSSASGLYISDVLHKAFVEINEEGTEAAAATAVHMRAKGIGLRPPKIPVFRADHPFLFFIRHKKTGSILFVGRLTDPR